MINFNLLDWIRFIWHSPWAMVNFSPRTLALLTLILIYLSQYSAVINWLFCTMPSPLSTTTWWLQTAILIGFQRKSVTSKDAMSHLVSENKRLPRNSIVWSKYFWKILTLVFPTAQEAATTSTICHLATLIESYSLFQKFIKLNCTLKLIVF